MSDGTEIIELRDGRSVRLGPIEPDHAECYRAYMVTLCSQTAWTGTLPDEVKDLEKQRERFEKLASQTPEDAREWVLGVFDAGSGAIVGDCGWHCIDYRKFRHVASLGIGILDHYHGVGLGRILMERAISAAKDDPRVLKIELGVFAENMIARRLYDSLGFEIEGVRKNALQQEDGEFMDDVVMGLWLGGDHHAKNA